MPYHRRNEYLDAASNLTIRMAVGNSRCFCVGGLVPRSGRLNGEPAREASSSRLALSCHRGRHRLPVPVVIPTGSPTYAVAAHVAITLASRVGTLTPGISFASAPGARVSSRSTIDVDEAVHIELAARSSGADAEPARRGTPGLFGFGLLRKFSDPPAPSRRSALVGSEGCRGSAVLSSRDIRQPLF